MLPKKILNVSNAIRTSAGSAFSTILKGDGRAYGSGANAYGQAGNGGTSDLNGFFLMGNSTDKIMYENLIDVVAGGTHTLLQEDTGKVYMMGLGTSGQLSQGSTANFTKRVEALILDDDPETDDIETKAIDNISFISAGNAFSIAITKDGKAYVCGLNTSGQLGQGDVTSPVNMFTPVKNKTGENDLSNVIFGAIGSSNTINSAYILNDGTVWTVGTGTSGQLASGSYENTYLVTKVGEDEFKAKENNITLQVNGTNQIQMSLTPGMNVYTNDSVLGTLTYESLNSEVATVSNTGLITAKRIGTTKIKITDSNTNLVAYVRVEALTSYNGVKAEVIPATRHTVALKADGTVWVWGNNPDGPSGNGSSSAGVAIKQPVQVLNPTGEGYVDNAIQVEAGYNHSVILFDDGTVACWGDNDTGECGNNSTADAVIPSYVVDINGEKIKDIIKVVASGDNTLALTKDGEIYSWGENDYGQLGNGTSSSGGYSKYAIKVKDVTGKGILTDISDVGMTCYTCYALTSSGELYSWGYNGHGACGIGNTTNQTLPRKVLIENVAKIQGTAYSAIALLETGEIYTWGYNGLYQLADGTTTSKI